MMRIHKARVDDIRLESYTRTMAGRGWDRMQVMHWLHTWFDVPEYRINNVLAEVFVPKVRITAADFVFLRDMKISLEG